MPVDKSGLDQLKLSPPTVMPHYTPLITTIVAALTLAWAFAAVAHSVKLPPLVGYLLAGVVVGPFTPGFVADQALAGQLAEIGVILLMFGVGLHFSLEDLLSVRAHRRARRDRPDRRRHRCSASGWRWLLGWSLGAGLVFGLALSVASTVVLLRALAGAAPARDRARPHRRRLADRRGPRHGAGAGAAAGRSPACSAATAERAASARIALWHARLTARQGRRLRRASCWWSAGASIPWLLHYVAHTGSRELFRLAVLAIALGVAFGAAKLFGVSFALGAFFAGMVLSESRAQPARGRGIAAAARRLRGAVLRLGRHAVRPDDPRRASRCRCSATLAIIVRRQVGRGLR